MPISTTAPLLLAPALVRTDITLGRGIRAQHGSAQLAFRNANNDPLIVGAPLLLSDRHAKVRREGYRR